MASVVVEVAAHGDVAVGHLIGVTIPLEAGQRLAGQVEWQQRIDLHAPARQLVAAVGGEEVEGRGRGHQVGHPLQGIALDVELSGLVCLAAGGVEQVEAAQPSVVPVGRLHQRRRPLQVGRVEPLPRVLGQLAVLPEQLHRAAGILLLLQVIIIGSGGDEELRACCAQPLLLVAGAQPFAIVGSPRRFALFVDATEALQGTVAVVVELLVARRALAELHAPHVGHEQLRLVARALLRLVEAAGRLVILHPHEGRHAQVVPRLGPASPVERGFVERLLCQSAALLRIAESAAVGLGVERIDPLHLALRHHLRAGRERSPRRRKSGQQGRRSHDSME